MITIKLETNYLKNDSIYGLNFDLGKKNEIQI